MSSFNIVPTEIEDAARDVAYKILMARKGQGLDRDPLGPRLVFLTGERLLDGASMYGRKVYYVERRGMPLIELAQPFIYGQRLSRLIDSYGTAGTESASADVDTKLTHWEMAVSWAIGEYGHALVSQDLLDVQPHPDDIAVLPTGPDEVRLKWFPELTRSKNGKLPTVNIQRASGLQWDWENRQFLVPSQSELTDPTRREA